MHHAAADRIRPDSAPPPASRPDRAGWPAIVVVEAQPVLSATLAELFEALRIRLLHVASGPALDAVLRHERPLGVMAHLPRAEPTATGTQIGDALGLVARHDSTLPVMVVTDQPANDVRAAGDIGARPLVNLVWMPRPPGLKMVIEFLFMAERRRGVPGLLPA